MLSDLPPLDMNSGSKLPMAVDLPSSARGDRSRFDAELGSMTEQLDTEHHKLQLAQRMRQAKESSNALARQWKLEKKQKARKHRKHKKRDKHAGLGVDRSGEASPSPEPEPPARPAAAMAVPLPPREPPKRAFDEADDDGAADMDAINELLRDTELMRKQVTPASTPRADAGAGAGAGAGGPAFQPGRGVRQPQPVSAPAPTEPEPEFEDEEERLKWRAQRRMAPQMGKDGRTKRITVGPLQPPPATHSDAADDDAAERPSGLVAVRIGTGLDGGPGRRGGASHVKLWSGAGAGAGGSPMDSAARARRPSMDGRADAAASRPTTIASPATLRYLRGVVLNTGNSGPLVIKQRAAKSSSSPAGGWSGSPSAGKK